MEEEAWKDIEGYEGLYQVSNMGRIKSLSRSFSGKWKGRRFVEEKILNPHINTGYLIVKLCKDSVHKNHKLHRLIAIAFIPNPENKPYINHKDGNRTNNTIENIEWVTPSENTQHAYKTKLMKPKNGETNGFSKLTTKQVNEIKSLLESKTKTHREIAKTYGVARTTITQINQGKNWNHI